MALEQDQRISDVVKREQSRLRNFIRRRVPDPRDAEDILQEVFYELVEANRLLMPIEHITGWLFRVARNRITDLFRKKKPESLSETAVLSEDDEGERLQLEDLLPSADAGPDAMYVRNVLLEELQVGGRGVAGGAARGICCARVGRAQLQGNFRRDRREHEYAALAQTLRGTASARTAAKRL